MKLLQVNYRREGGDEAMPIAQQLESAERIAQLPGLQWKIWIRDEEAGRGGGIYLFDTEEHARAFGDELLPRSLGSYPGVSEIEARYFDVDEQMSAITRAPLAAPERA